MSALYTLLYVNLDTILHPYSKSLFVSYRNCCLQSSKSWSTLCLSVCAMVHRTRGLLSEGLANRCRSPLPCHIPQIHSFACCFHVTVYTTWLLALNSTWQNIGRVHSYSAGLPGAPLHRSEAAVHWGRPATLCSSGALTGEGQQGLCTGAAQDPNQE